MGGSVADDRSAALLLRTDIRPRMAKADVRKAERREWREEVGAAIERAVGLCGWSLKEFAAAGGRDERQCARWLTGQERPQFDVLFAVDALRVSLVQALAELAGHDIEIETTIRIRRSA